MKYTIHTTVDRVEEKFETRVEKRGTEYTPVNTSRGWFILFEGSHEFLFLGKEKPILRGGDSATITIERIEKTSCLPLLGEPHANP